MKRIKSLTSSLVRTKIGESHEPTGFSNTGPSSASVTMSRLMFQTNSLKKLQISAQGLSLDAECVFGIDLAIFSHNVELASVSFCLRSDGLARLDTVLACISRCSEQRCATAKADVDLDASIHPCRDSQRRHIFV